MIKDNIRNYKEYTLVHDGIHKAFNYLINTNLDELSIGVHDISNNDIFAIVSEYKTQNQNIGLWEAHRKYIDVQYLIKGTEKIGYCDINQLIVEKQYDEEADVVLGHLDGDYITLREGDFMILFPQDAHKPGKRDKEELNIKKIVIKVKYTT